MKIVDKRGNTDDPQDGDYAVVESDATIEIPISVLLSLLEEHRSRYVRQAAMNRDGQWLREALQDDSEALPTYIVDAIVAYLSHKGEGEG